MLPTGMTETPGVAGTAIAGSSALADRAARDEGLRRKIVEVAAQLFAEHGYGGTKVGMVAERAGVTPKTVRRLTGGRVQLFASAIASQVTSEAAARVASAAAHPEVMPPLAVLIEASALMFATPRLGWSVLELEALMHARRDEGIRALESTRLDERCSNMKAVLAQARRAGGLDDDVDDAALVQLAIALSVGLSVLEPVFRPPRRDSWTALMARIGESVAPTDQLMGPGYGVRKPWRLRVDIPNRAGALARLARAMSTLHGYIVSTAVLASGDGIRTVDLAVTVPENVSAEVLLAAAMSAGSNVYVTDGSVEDGLDVPTQVLDVATELVRNPGSAPSAAAGLVHADRFEVTDATEGDDDAAGILRLQWTADGTWCCTATGPPSLARSRLGPRPCCAWPQRSPGAKLPPRRPGGSNPSTTVLRSGSDWAAPRTPRRSRPCTSAAPSRPGTAAI